MYSSLLYKIKFYSMRFLSLFILILFPLISFSQWIRLSTIIDTNLSDVICSDSLNVFIAGSGGTILHSKDLGESWSINDTVTSEDLKDISFVNDSIGFICGYNGTLLKTYNKGYVWEIINTNISENLRAIEFANPDTGYMISLENLYFSNNGGLSWTIIDNISVGHFGDIAFSDSGHFCVLAWHYCLGCMVYKTSDYFQTCETFIDPDAQYNGWWTGASIDISTSGTIFIGGLSNGRVRIPSASNWHYMGENLHNSEVVCDLFFHNNSHFLYAIGLNGCIEIVYFSGYNTIQTTPTTRNLHGIDFIDDNIGFACGANGVILKTTNGGYVELPEFDIREDNIIVFPNPIISKIPSKIKTYKYLSNGFCIVYNQNGRIVYSKQNLYGNNHDINLKNLMKGVYILTVFDSNFKGSTKLLIQ